MTTWWLFVDEGQIPAVNGRGPFSTEDGDGGIGGVLVPHEALLDLERFKVDWMGAGFPYPIHTADLNAAKSEDEKRIWRARLKNLCSDATRKGALAFIGANSVPGSLVGCCQYDRYRLLIDTIVERACWVLHESGGEHTVCVVPEGIRLQRCDACGGGYEYLKKRELAAWLRAVEGPTSVKLRECAPQGKSNATPLGLCLADCLLNRSLRPLWRADRTLSQTETQITDRTGLALRQGSRTHIAGDSLARIAHRTPGINLASCKKWARGQVDSWRGFWRADL